MALAGAPSLSRRSSVLSAASIPSMRAFTSRALASAASALPASTKPNLGSRNGSIDPWPTSVTMITQKVTNRISGRSGKGAPPIIAGIDSAATSEMTPRMPVNPMMKGFCQFGFGSRLRIALNNRRGR